VARDDRQGVPVTPRDRARLNGVHPDLVRVVEAAAKITAVPFIVTEGKRTLARQKELVAAGASKTLNSRHLTGHAVDLAALVGGEVRWDWPLYSRIAAAMKDAAKTLGVAIVWGGDWRSFRDGPHFELDRKVYP
jgi:peptidoglycan L-alanyl-D-glutamate endopeptidase CwlK